MDWMEIGLLLGGGLIAGSVNTLAGGGSSLTVPLLIFLGLPGTLANGTNRVAILLQTLTATRQFHKQGVIDWRRARWLFLPAMAGAIVGASIAASLDRELLKRTIGIVMLVVLPIRPYGLFGTEEIRRV